MCHCDAELWPEFNAFCFRKYQVLTGSFSNSGKSLQKKKARDKYNIQYVGNLYARTMKGKWHVVKAIVNSQLVGV